MTGLDALIKMVSPVVTGLGYELWGCELANTGRSQTLRIYIDSPDGIDVEDCATVSRQVSAVLDVEDPITGNYTLEVSSPGLDRSLFYLDQYERYIGHPIKLRLKMAATDRRKNFVGTIAAVEDERIRLALEKEEVVFDYSNIAHANLV